MSGQGHDVLSLSSAQFSGIAQVLAHTQDVNGNAVIHVGQQETITLGNVTTAQLQSNHQDFKFHA